jgi:hypothetical protein
MRRMTFEAVLFVSFLTICLIVGVNWLIDLPHQVSLTPILALLALFIGAAIGNAAFAFADFSRGRPALLGTSLGVSVEIILLLMPAVRW